MASKGDREKSVREPTNGHPSASGEGRRAPPEELLASPLQQPGVVSHNTAPEHGPRSWASVPDGRRRSSVAVGRVLILYYYSTRVSEYK